jgi:hypothetical protein
MLCSLKHSLCGFQERLRQVSELVGTTSLSGDLQLCLKKKHLPLYSLQNLFSIFEKKDVRNEVSLRLEADVLTDLSLPQPTVFLRVWEKSVEEI